MTDRPILFSAPMVRALLDGRKTQTRRVLKPQPPRFMHYGKDIMDWGLSGIYQDDDNVGTNRWWLDVQTDVDDNSHGEIKVAAAVGDRLWVRETLACCVDWGLFYDAHGGIGPREEHFLRDDRAEAIVDRYSRDDETICECSVDIHAPLGLPHHAGRHRCPRRAASGYHNRGCDSRRPATHALRGQCCQAGRMRLGI